MTAVARARGVTPRGFGNFRPEAFAAGAPERDGRQVVAWLVDYTSQTAKTHSGIYRDLAVRRRKTEVDAQIGIIGGLAREHGLSTPALDRLVTLIHDIEDGRRELSIETFNELLATCKSASITAS